MSESVQAMTEAGHARDPGVTQRRIRFVERIASGDRLLMAFKDPEQRYAILAEGPARATFEPASDLHGELLDVTLVPSSNALQTTPFAINQLSMEWLKKADAPVAPPAIFVKYRGVELIWRPDRALLQCDSEQAEFLLAALIEFTHYECELRRIEGEIANTWVELEQDKELAFEVTPADLQRSQAVGARMNRVLQRRMRLARIEPHLYQPEAGLPAASQKLGEELREKARIESRLETVDGQLEVFEDIYEMSGQRMGEYRAAQKEHILEWVIIVLLAAELLLMLAQSWSKLRA
jgi:hypothetical protein